MKSPQEQLQDASRPSGTRAKKVEEVAREIAYFFNIPHGANYIAKLIAKYYPSPTPSREQVKHMVDRFLGWKLPENFNPDGGISFQKSINEHPMKNAPTGTNLLDAIQAEAMVRYMIEGLQIAPSAPESPSLPVGVEGVAKALGDLIARLDYVHADERYMAVWIMYAIHGGKYIGPKYDQELEAARNVLTGCGQNDVGTRVDCCRVRNHIQMAKHEGSDY